MISDSTVLRSRLSEILARFADVPDLGPGSIDLLAPVFGPGGIITDSLRVLDALCEIEDSLEVSVPDEDLTEELFASVESLARYLESHGGAEVG